MSFSEQVLDLGISGRYGSVGGPEFETDIVRHGVGGRLETRTDLAENGRIVIELGERDVDGATLDTLLAFFRARKARFQGFRIRDWADYQATAEALAPDGGPTVQLRKTYTSGAESEIRPITKPEAGSVSLTRGGAAFAGWSLDATTGVLTLTPDATQTITAATAAAPAQLTITGHGLTTGDVIYVTATGMPAIDAAAWPVTVVDANTLTLDGSDTTGQTFDGSGTAATYVQPGEALAWSGTFHVPVRFDTPSLPTRFDSYRAADGQRWFFLPSVPVIEVEPD